MREEKDPFRAKAFFISKNRRYGNKKNHTVGSLTFYKASGEKSEEKAVQGWFLMDSTK